MPVNLSEGLQWNNYLRYMAKMPCIFLLDRFVKLFLTYN